MTAAGHADRALEPIAIIGMACIFPQAADLQAFWNNIVASVDAIGEPVPNWDAQRYLDSGRIKTPMGGWLKDLYRFDPREFGIMPNSMDGGEPDHFLALKVARDALVDAGYADAAADHRDTGIILGHSTYLHRGQATVIQHNIVLDQTVELLKAALPGIDDARLAELRALLAKQLPPTNSDTAPGLVPNVMTGRIANRLNFKGPNYLVDAACSSSLLAVSAAIDELRAGRSRLMLAGGVNASLPADVSTIFTQLGALSARGKVRPFETGSDGTLLGEGLGVVVLKRLSDALDDGDRVYACIRGVGQASDGRGTGLLAPSVDGETLAIRRAYDATGIDPASVGMVEAHGTGIPLGDKTEIAALTNVFGSRAAGGQGSIAIGSVKSMISHCIPAAGVAGLIKASLALHHRVLPPTLCDSVNPELGIDRSRLYVNTEAMPWLAPLDVPRRAGVDSFGFGGINTHAIVEQAPAAAARPLLLQHWPFELCVLSGADAAAVAAAAESLLAALERNAAWSLAEIAAALARVDSGASARLAIVAKSREALAKALAAAVAKLRDAQSPAVWSTRTGAHFTARPTGGKLAFLFPGEGSQYLHMLADLAQCFDEVREWLDFWRGLYADEPGATRTDIAFPPATELTPERRKRLEARLHDMDVGSEAVMVGGQALNALLRACGVEPDAMLGHSSGESSALAASRALPAADFASLAAFIRELNAVYQRVLGEGRIPTGALLAVGALPHAMVHAALESGGEPIEIAMDNCANQLVLYGARADIDAVQARLAALGGICMPLPFDRGYHTPDFGGVSAAFRAYYASIGLEAPQVPLYSCASAALFPREPEAVRDLAAAQWSQTVRFRETVLAMVDDGVRTFVEVGPSGNLTAFVDDVLAEQPHVALATNVRRKHGLEQFMATLAQLWTGGRDVRFETLYARRRIAGVDLAVDTPPRREARLLDNTLPTLRFDDALQAQVRALLAGAMPAAAREPSLEPAAPPEPAAPMVAVEAAEEAPPAAGEQVMGDYFDLMRGFLAQQHDVVAGLRLAPADDADDDAPQQLPTPFIDAIVTHEPGRLHARCSLGVHRDAFLRDHVLSGRGSATDPDLLGLSCVPLMVSLEIMAEAVLLLAGALPVAIEQVRAQDWIALDDGELTLDVSVTQDAGGRCHARIDNAGQPAISADFVFDTDMRSTPLPPLPPLAAPRAARWDGAGIYDIGMFHGPIFQSLAHVRGWGAAGIDCELGACRLDGFFEPGAWPRMVLNPIVLDAMGQLAACWVAEHVGTDFNCFPSTIDRIELLAACPEEGGIVVRGRQAAIDPAQPADIAAARRWDFEAVDATGNTLVRVSGLVNVYFDVPHRYYELRRDPLGGWLGAPLGEVGDAALWQLDHLPEAFCAQSNGIFLRMLAHAVLSFDERELWRALPGGVRQRRQWLLGRLAIKEAVRHWLHGTSGELVYPSDIVVGHDAHGAPVVDGWWAAVLAPPPQVSLSHDAVTSVAAVALGDGAVGIDIEQLGRIRRPESMVAAFTPAEQAWLAAGPADARDERLLRLWCAKEAAAKCLGTGLRGSPEAFETTFESGGCETAVVQRDATIVPVIAMRVENSVIAVAEYQSRITRVNG